MPQVTIRRPLQNRRIEKQTDTEVNLQMQSDSPAHCFLIPELLDQVLAHTQQGRFFKLSIRKRLPWKGVCCVSVPVE
jgi:hypothetical protein